MLPFESEIIQYIGGGGGGGQNWVCSWESRTGNLATGSGGRSYSYCNIPDTVMCCDDCHLLLNNAHVGVNGPMQGVGGKEMLTTLVSR
jgi:hypothetical protein